MGYGMGSGRLAAAWQRLLAAAFAFAAVALPALAWAQGTGGSSTGPGAPPSNPPAGAPREGGGGLAWLVVLLAIGVAIWLYTRRRTRHAHRM